MRKVLLLSVLLWLSGQSAVAHEEGPLKQWFQGLHSSYGGPCCAEADGLADPEWESNKGHYRVHIPISKGSSDLVWVNVPDEAVIKDPNLDGRVWVWPFYSYGSPVAVRCFMPGSMT